jgi:hypothetical protein
LIVPDAFGIMAVDPGGKSGVAQGVFSNRETAKQTLRRALRKGMMKATVFDGAPEEQAHYIAASWRSFKYMCVVELSIPEPNVYLAVEDFQLRQMAVDLVPVEVVAGLRAVQRVPVTNGWHDDVMEGKLKRPSASEAKGYATNDRMKLVWRAMNYGSVYDLGRGRGYGDHARDALRHVCLGVSKCLAGKW